MTGEIVALLVVFIIFSIPLSAIFLNSPLGKAIGRYVERRLANDTKLSETQIGEMKKMQEELMEQRKLIYQLQEDNQKLDEKYSFLERLLEEPKS